MEEVLAQAEGIDGRIELLQDGIRVRRKGLLGRPTKDHKEFLIEQISSVDYRKPGLMGGYIEFSLRGQQPPQGDSFGTSEERVSVQFGLGSTKAFEAIKRAIEPRVQARREQAEGPIGVSAPELTESTLPNKPNSKVAGGSEVLSKKVRKLAQQNMSEDETVRFCLLSPSGIGGWSQAIVALDDRLLVIKPGMAAMATFGARVTSFYYRDITGIEVNTGLVQGVIEINTPSYQGIAQKDFWSVRDNNKNPFQVTNCLPISKRDLKDYRPYIDRLRTMIREAKHGPTTPPAPHQSGNTLSSELEKLVSLRDLGVLTDEEFQQAKKRLIS